MENNTLASFGAKMVVKKKLSNGMHVVVIPTSVRPRVLVQMLYDVGSASEQDGERGLAHLLEHMIFKGTPSLQEGAIAKLAARYGAKFNAFTWFDLTSYYFEVDSNNWKPFIPLLADCMENVSLDKEHLASEVKAVIQELRMRNDNPNVFMFDTLLGSMFPENHPYFHPLIGYKKDLASITADQLRNFYKKYYVPERATLIVVGDVQADDVVAEVEHNFSHIPASGFEFPVSSSADIPKITGFHKVFPKHWVRSHSMVAWSVPLNFDENADIAHMLIKLLGEGETSILHKRLVDQDRIADNVGVSVLELLHEAVFYVYVLPKEGKADACAAAIQDELQKLVQKGFDARVLERSLKSEHLDFELTKEAPTTRLLSLSLLTSYIKKGSFDEAFNIGERLAKVTPGNVKAFVERYLTSDARMRIDVVPQDEAQKEAWRLEQLAEQELEKQILAVHQRTLPLPENVVVPVSEKYPDVKPTSVPIILPTGRTRLANGLEIVFKEEQNTDLCAFRFEYLDNLFLNSSMDGYLWTIVQSLFIEGAAGFTREELSDWLQDRGLQLVAFQTGFFWCLKEDFQDLVKKYFEVFFNPDFLQTEGWLKRFFGSSHVKTAFEKIKEHMITAVKSMYDSPQTLAAVHQMAARYPETPFALSIDDRLKALRALELSDVRDFYKKICNPSQWVLSLAGRFDQKAILSVVEAATAGWKDVASYRLERELTAKQVANIDIPVSRDQVFVQYLREVPLPASDVTVERVSVDMLSWIYLSGMASRIFKLRDATGIFYSCGGSLGAPMQAGFLRTQDTVWALVSPEKVNEACALFEAFIKNVFALPITQQEFDDARQALRSRMAESYAGVAAEANYFVILALYRRDESFRKRYLDVLDALTMPQVQAVAQKYGALGGFMRVRVGTLPA